jgi:hypothetical protein
MAGWYGRSLELLRKLGLAQLQPLVVHATSAFGTSRNFSAMQNSIAIGAWRTSSKPSPRSIWLKLSTGLPYLYGEPLPGRATSGQGRYQLISNVETTRTLDP